MSPEQRQRRDQLERSVAALRSKKGQMPEDEYYTQLETIMTELARLYRKAASPS